MYMFTYFHVHVYNMFIHVCTWYIHVYVTDICNIFCPDGLKSSSRRLKYIKAIYMYIHVTYMFIVCIRIVYTMIRYVYT
jgi:hypothetical protein